MSEVVNYKSLMYGQQMLTCSYPANTETKICCKNVHTYSCIYMIHLSHRNVWTAFQITMSDHIDSLTAIVNDVIQREGTIWVKMASWIDRHTKFCGYFLLSTIPPPCRSINYTNIHNLIWFTTTSKVHTVTVVLVWMTYVEWDRKLHNSWHSICTILLLRLI